MKTLRINISLKYDINIKLIYSKQQYDLHMSSKNTMMSV